MSKKRSSESNTDNSKTTKKAKIPTITLQGIPIPYDVAAIFINKLAVKERTVLRRANKDFKALIKDGRCWYSDALRYEGFFGKDDFTYKNFIKLQKTLAMFTLLFDNKTSSTPERKYLQSILPVKHKFHPTTTFESECEDQLNISKETHLKFYDKWIADDHSAVYSREIFPLSLNARIFHIKTLLKFIKFPFPEEWFKSTGFDTPYYDGDYVVYDFYNILAEYLFRMLCDIPYIYRSHYEVGTSHDDAIAERSKRIDAQTAATMNDTVAITLSVKTSMKFECFSENTIFGHFRFHMLNHFKGDNVTYIDFPELKYLKFRKGCTNFAFFGNTEFSMCQSIVKEFLAEFKRIESLGAINH